VPYATSNLKDTNWYIRTYSRSINANYNMNAFLTKLSRFCILVHIYMNMCMGCTQSHHIQGQAGAPVCLIKWKDPAQYHSHKAGKEKMILKFFVDGTRNTMQTTCTLRSQRAWKKQNLRNQIHSMFRQSWTAFYSFYAFYAWWIHFLQ
jgi:hypothetical protein